MGGIHIENDRAKNGMWTRNCDGRWADGRTVVGKLLGTADDVGQGVEEVLGRYGDGIGGDEVHFGTDKDHMWSE